MSDAATATPKKQFLALLKEHGLKAERVASINGEIGERVKHCIENANLHRGAYNLVRKLAKMSEEKRTDFLGSFEIYSDYAREGGLFGSEHVGDLVEDAQRDEAAEQRDADEAQTAANVEALTNGIKQLDPNAEEDDFERGRVAFLDGKPGMIPDDLQGKPKRANVYLEGWSAASKESAERHDAEKAGQANGVAATKPENQGEVSTDPFEDDAAAAKPSRRRGKAALDGADASGSYSLQH